MRWLRVIVIAFALSIAWPAAAGDLTVTMIDDDGTPVSDAVVTVMPSASTPDSASVSSHERAASTTKMVDPKDQNFLLFVPVLRPGHTVVAGNTVPEPLTLTLALIPDPRRRINHEHLGY
jgi:hypothetical protein